MASQAGGLVQDQNFAHTSGTGTNFPQSFCHID